MEQSLQIIKSLPTIDAFFLFLGINIGIFILSELLGKWFLVQYSNKRITEPPSKITNKEILLVISTILLNTLVTNLGLWLWQNNIIQLSFGLNLWIIIDFFVLFLVMDLFMYLFHRAAHIPLLYKILHQTHHEYKALRPLTLFVLNPIENLGFGVLWLVVISFYSANWYAMLAYLVINVLFGLVGHLGVEPLTKKSQNRISKLITTSYFHALHHTDEKHNFGFYTTVYDRFFSTISKKYDTHFGEKLD